MELCFDHSSFPILPQWSDALNKFCSAEFSVKTKVFHCCKKAKSATRERCFVSESPFPNYDFKDTRDGDTQGEASDCASGTPSGCKTAEKLPAISFPPGEPSDANIKNICQLRKFRPYYSPNALPQTGFGWFERQARAVNRIESEFKKCCRKEDASCARKGVSEARLKSLNAGAGFCLIFLLPSISQHPLLSQNRQVSTLCRLSCV